MAYDALDITHPVIGGARLTEIDYTRRNLAALRDAIVALGGIPGFNYSYGVAGGGTAAQPTEMAFARDPERVYLALTWGTAGGSAGNVTKIAFYYSANAGVNYSPMTDTAGKYVLSLAYDSESNLIATTWGSTP